MKAFLFSISIVAVILAATSCSSVKATPEAADNVTKQVQAKDYTIDVNMVNPLRGKSIILTDSYELRVKGDSAYAFLPYFGVAQQPTYGDSDGGVKFNEPMKNYTITPNKKNNGWDISFKVDTKNHNYELSLTVFNNGSASFNVNSMDRDMISYSGEVRKK